MEKKTKVLEVAKFIIEKTATIQMTADHFGMSTSSIKKYINNDLKEIDEDIYNKVKIVQKNLEEYGRQKGSKIGKRGPKYTDFEALEIAETMIANQMTIEEASEYFGMPRVSLYESIKRVDNQEIQTNLELLFKKNKQDSARIASRQ